MGALYVLPVLQAKGGFAVMLPYTLPLMQKVGPDESGMPGHGGAVVRMARQMLSHCPPLTPVDCLFEKAI